MIYKFIMFEYIKIDRNVVYYLIIVAFFLSFNSWYTIQLGIINLLFSIIFTFLSYLITLFIFNIVGSWYGLYINLPLVTAEIKKLIYPRENPLEKIFIPIIALIILFFLFNNDLFLLVVSYLLFLLFYRIYLERSKKEKKDTINITIAKRINLSYILTIFISLISFGYFVPIIFSLKPVIIEYKRIGRSRNLEVSNSELIRIVFISLLLLWIFYSYLKYFSTINPLLFGFTKYFFYYLFFFTYMSIIPLGMILSPYISIRRGYSYSNKFIGDILIISKLQFYIPMLITLSLLPIFSIIFNPIQVIIITFLIFSVIWLRKTFDAIVSK
ncbi:MAG: hypothetical protein ACP5G1_01650 [Nanopusillaceae archaeon]